MRAFAAPISLKIRERFGTVKHFCKLNGCNPGSLKVVLQGDSKSQAVVDALLKNGFIKHASDLPQYKEEGKS